jgi:hypothetical protein
VVKHTLSATVTTTTPTGMTAGLSGVSVTTSGGTCTTGGNGNCTIPGLVAGKYTVTASKSGYELIPKPAQVEIPNATTPQIVYVSFSDTPQVKHSIRATVTTTTPTGMTAGLSGVSVTTSGGNCTTDGSGSCLIPNLVAGKYTVTASKGGAEINPKSSLVEIPNATTPQIAYVSFSDTPLLKHSLRATVTTTTPTGMTAGLDGATVSAGGGTCTTDGSGTCTIPNLVAGKYTATATKTGYDITPKSTPVEIPDATPSQIVYVSFSGTAVGGQAVHSITATVTDEKGGVKGAAITAAGPSSGSCTTGDTGSCTMGSLKPGAYSVTAKVGAVTLPSASVTLPDMPSAQVRTVSFSVKTTVAPPTIGAVSGVSVAQGGSKSIEIAVTNTTEVSVVYPKEGFVSCSLSADKAKVTCKIAPSATQEVRDYPGEIAACNKPAGATQPVCTSTTFQITVTKAPAVQPPTISLAPSAITVAPGGSASVKVSGNGKQPVTVTSDKYVSCSVSWSTTTGDYSGTCDVTAPTALTAGQQHTAVVTACSGGGVGVGACRGVPLVISVIAAKVPDIIVTSGFTLDIARTNETTKVTQEFDIVVKDNGSPLTNFSYQGDGLGITSCKDVPALALNTKRCTTAADARDLPTNNGVRVSAERVITVYAANAVGQAQKREVKIYLRPY